MTRPKLSARVVRRIDERFLQVALSFIALLSGLVFLLHPDTLSGTAVGVLRVDYIWSIGWVVAGAMTIAGVMVGNGRLEIGGIGLFMISLSIYAMAIIYYRGTEGLVSAGVMVVLIYALQRRFRELLAISSRFPDR